MKSLISMMTHTILFGMVCCIVYRTLK